MKKIFILSSLIAVTLATPSFAEPTELDKKTVASKAYVDTKQDIIEAGVVTFREPEEQIDYTVPSLVSYGTGTNNADGLLGNKIGILGIDQSLGGLYSYNFLDMGDDESVYLDNFVPTVRAVAYALEPTTWHQINTPNIINTYRVSFADDDDNLVNGYFLGKTLALKQNKLPAKNTGDLAPKGKQAVVLDADGYPSNVYTTAGKDLALTAKSGAQKVMNYIDGTTASATFATSQSLAEAGVKSALVSLELLKDVYDVLNTKITNNALPTGTTGTVVTYNGTNATTGVQEFTETAMTGAVTYTNGTLDNANDIATITAVGTRQKKKECGGYEPAAAGQPAHDGTHPGDEDYCWLWIFPED